MTNIQVGDWVRFYRGGVMVTGVVEYVTKHSVLNKYNLCTDVGSVDTESILEVRKKP